MITVNIKTKENNWNYHKEGNRIIYFVGYIDFKGIMILEAKELENLITTVFVDDIENYILEQFLPYANGNFAFIIKENDYLLAITDYTRNYPVLLAINKSEFTISDHLINNLFKSEAINIERCEEFLISGFVIGQDTIFNNCISLQPGEVLKITNGEYFIERYFNLVSDPLKKGQYLEKEVVFEQIDQLFMTLFERMIKSCPNVRNWVVPLSGGHDSRMILNYLYQLGCKNVVCFTYGSIGSEEVKISMETASKLGYEWHFVDYLDNSWVQLHQSNLFDDYINYSFNGCNLPHTQDLLALYILKERGVLSTMDCIVPGHTAFTEIESESILRLTTESQAVDFVYSRYYTLFKAKNEEALKRRIGKLFRNNNQTPLSFPEFFNWQERQVKFIGNSVRAYEFFGIKWRLPFWEKEVIDYWQSLEYKDRIERKILFEASKNRLFIKELLEVPLINKFKKKQVESSFLQNLIPFQLRSIIVRIVNRNVRIGEATNQTYLGAGADVKEILKPLHFFPSTIKKIISPYLVRRPYQINVNALTSIYTLKLEVFKKALNK